MDWKIKQSEVVLKDQWIHVRADQCEMPDGKIIEPYYVLQYPDWANALALTKDLQVILIRQYRHGLGKTIIELPGGNIDPNEAPIDAVRRELLEETGYAFEEILPTSTVSPNPANHANLAYSFLALGGVVDQAQALEQYEDIRVELYTLEALQEMLDQNELPQAMHVSSIYYGLKKLKALGLWQH